MITLALSHTELLIINKVVSVCLLTYYQKSNLSHTELFEDCVYMFINFYLKSVLFACLTQSKVGLMHSCSSKNSQKSLILIDAFGVGTLHKLFAKHKFYA